MHIHHNLLEGFQTATRAILEPSRILLRVETPMERQHHFIPLPIISILHRVLLSPVKDIASSCSVTCHLYWRHIHTRSECFKRGHVTLLKHGERTKYFYCYRSAYLIVFLTVPELVRLGYLLGRYSLAAEGQWVNFCLSIRRKCRIVVFFKNRSFFAQKYIWRKCAKMLSRNLPWDNVLTWLEHLRVLIKFMAL